MYIEHQKIIDTFKARINLLISLYEETKKEKELFIQEKNELLNLINEKNNKISELEEQINTLKLANSLVSGENGHDAKIKINRIVREIDKCIALLNK
ncbi:MAG: hypothetical protein CSA05_02505 [Bacteroidia bacterium]|nr:MAG: hypothetical protein CSA05_02505 [Bacteroidia bacterium]